MQQTSYDFKIKKKKSHNAKWLVPPFYVRNMNTEGGKINYVGLEKKSKDKHVFVSLLLVKKKPEAE